MRVRRRQRKKSLSFSALILVFIITLLTFSVGYSLLSQDLSIKGTASITGDTVVKNEFRTDNLLLTYEINSWYSNGRTYYQYNFTLENIGVVDFDSWELVVYLPADTEQVGGWEAQYTLDMGNLLVKNLEGRTLPSGTSASFGYQFSTVDDTFELTKVKMEGVVITLGETGGETGGETEGGDDGETGGETGGGTEGGDDGETEGGDGGETGGETGETVTGALEVSFTKTTTWGSDPEYYHQYTFTVNNVSEQTLSSWAFNIIVPEGTSMYQIWNANYIDSDGVITISNGDTNENLQAGGSLTIGMVLISSSNEISISVE